MQGELSARARACWQVDEVVGDRRPGVEDIKALRLTTRVICEALRLYPQPPVLIRRALEADMFAGFAVAPGSDIFISVWNIHRCGLRSSALVLAVQGCAGRDAIEQAAFACAGTLSIGSKQTSSIPIASPLMGPSPMR